MRRILCAVDFSPSSEAALGEALAIARVFEAALTVLHVAGPPTSLLPDGGHAVAATARTATGDSVATARLEALRARIVESGFRDVETRTAVGVAWRAIVDEAGSGGHDLLVVGTHGRTGVRRLLLGSVAEHVVRHAPCPVLTVQGGARPLPAPAPAP